MAEASTVHRAAIALGSNLDSAQGTRAEHLLAALEMLEDPPTTRVLARSAAVETAPVGPVPQGAFLNAACIVQTTLGPRALLERLLEIERVRGRDRAREGRWGPRTLDLDLILYADLVVDEPGLTIPHPRLSERSFVLVPLAEVAPDWRVPGCRPGGATIRELLAALEAAARTGA